MLTVNISIKKIAAIFCMVIFSSKLATKVDELYLKVIKQAS
jgi:hypothetical protein